MTDLNKLDRKIAEIEGLHILRGSTLPKGALRVCVKGRSVDYHPTRDPALWGPLMEKYWICIDANPDEDDDDRWFALVPDLKQPLKGYRNCYVDKGRAYGESLGIAICKAIVAAHD